MDLGAPSVNYQAVVDAQNAAASAASDAAEVATAKADIIAAAGATNPGLALRMAAVEEIVTPLAGQRGVSDRKILTTNPTYAAGNIIEVDASRKILGLAAETLATNAQASADAALARPSFQYRKVLSTAYPAGTIVDTDAAHRTFSAEASGGSGGSTSTGPARLYHYESATYRSSILTASQLTATRPCVYAILQFGQSLDIGGVGETATAQAIKTSPVYASNVLMLSAGLRPDTGTSTSFAAAVETVSGSSGDTGVVALMNRLVSISEATHGYRPIFLGIVQGAGGVALDNFLRGSTRNRLLVANVAEAKSICDGLGWDLVVMGVRSLHGNANFGNTSKARYRRMHEQFARQLNEDVKAITKQADDLRFWIAQPDSFNTDQIVGVIEAQNEQARLDPTIEMLAAHYDVPRDDANSVHPSNLAYVWMAERDAEKVFVNYFGKGQAPFQPDRVRFYSSTVLEYVVPVPVPPLVLDTSGYVTTTGLGAGYGHEFDDGSGSPPAITGVTITDADMAEGPAARVRVTLASAPTGPYALLSYAMRGTTGQQNGPVTGARGCLRDSSAAVASIGTDGLTENGTATRYLYEWMNRWALYATR